MHAFAIINFHELTPPALCDVVRHKFHHAIEQAADQVASYFTLERQDDTFAPSSADIQQLLFSRLHAEVIQTIRKEDTILYPVIKSQQPQSPPIKCIQHATFVTIRHSFQKITLLLQKIRQVAGNYQIQSNWSSAYKLCINDMYITEQLIMQWIYVTQNILYPSVTKPGTIIIEQNDFNNATSID
ncbi:hypothetical protein ACE38W_11715 [Chitinophaga sp. Hz27]|uniref:hypothetical protein n=1 Tax=Chitinophaga sp. Hz27 TaxID=3347169 RepID=UPI0035E0704D